METQELKQLVRVLQLKDCLMISGSIKDGAGGRLIWDFDTGTNSSLNRSLAIGFSSKYILGV